MSSILNYYLLAAAIASPLLLDLLDGDSVFARVTCLALTFGVALFGGLYHDLRIKRNNSNAEKSE